MRNPVHILTIVAAMLLFSSCHRNDEMENAFASSDAMALTISGEKVFEYDQNTCQVGCNLTTFEFRVHTDTMSDYYIVELKAIPTSVGQTISGNLYWTSENSISKREGMTFKVERMEADGRIWLWSSSGRIGAVVQLVED